MRDRSTKATPLSTADVKDIFSKLYGLMGAVREMLTKNVLEETRKSPKIFVEDVHKALSRLVKNNGSATKHTLNKLNSVINKLICKINELASMLGYCNVSYNNETGNNVSEDINIKRDRRPRLNSRMENSICFGYGGKGHCVSDSEC